MMLTLATDTTGKSLSIALTRAGRLLGETSLHLGFNHSVTLMPQIQILLASCDCRLADVDLFACAVGPGSFTGIRIGVSAVKAMAYAAGKPAIGVSTLDILAAPYVNIPDLVTAILLDARNGRAFAAASLNGLTILPAANWLAADFLEQLAITIGTSPLTAAQRAARQAPAVLLLGDGADLALADWQPPAGMTVRRAPHSCDVPRASLLASLAEARLVNGENADAQNLAANYLSQSAAQRRQAAIGEPSRLSAFRKPPRS